LTGYTGKKMTVLGLMSGTSLDGLDLALCAFDHHPSGYAFTLLKADTLSYSPHWKEELAGVKRATAEEYFSLHARYGNFIGHAVNTFLKDVPHRPEIIASHGHTVFHQPERGFSTQTGCGATIAAVTGITTVCDFRSTDVAYGGQGAPLVPIGDRHLFANYHACLNLGGIANISFETPAGRIAYDICEANMLLNHLAEKAGHAFDRAGAIARSGRVIPSLLDVLNGQSYYSQSGARSMGREWFEKNILHLIETTSAPVHDLLATATAHVAHIIARELAAHHIKNVLVTGGGAFNTFLLESIYANLQAAAHSCELILPSAEIINFKEALIFAFLGYLRMHNQVNALSSVTGAARNSIGGAVYLGA